MKQRSDPARVGIRIEELRYIGITETVFRGNSMLGLKSPNDSESS